MSLTVPGTAGDGRRRMLKVGAGRGFVVVSGLRDGLFPLTFSLMTEDANCICWACRPEAGGGRGALAYGFGLSAECSATKLPLW